MRTAALLILLAGVVGLLLQTDATGEDPGGNRAIAAVMIESNLVEGNQKDEPGKELVYGQSITDSCVSWETTEEMLEGFAEAVRRRRGAAG